MLVGLVFGAFFFAAATAAAVFLPFKVGISAGGFLAGVSVDRGDARHQLVNDRGERPHHRQRPAHRDGPGPPAGQEPFRPVEIRLV